jgi:hypothetical protein
MSTFSKFPDPATTCLEIERVANGWTVRRLYTPYSGEYRPVEFVARTPSELSDMIGFWAGSQTDGKKD